MTDVAAPIQVMAARARWRADLLKFSAAEHRRIVGDDPSPVAQQFVAAADAKEAEAAIHLDHAAAGEALSIAKAELDANPKDPGAQQRRDAAQAAMRDLRSYWRQIGEANGTRFVVQRLDDFSEPTDEEVLASHGGTP